MARAYGVLRALGLYAARQTFYIGMDGRILAIDTDVDPDTAGTVVAARLARLGVAER